MIKWVARMILIATTVFFACALFAKSRPDPIYINIDGDRTVEIFRDGKVLHVSATDTSGKTKCTVAPLNDDKGFSIICAE
jgi:hypothetical protein